MVFFIFYFLSEMSRYNTLTVAQLKQELTKRQLGTYGLKADLIARLEQNDEEDAMLTKGENDNLATGCGDGIQQSDSNQAGDMTVEKYTDQSTNSEQPLTDNSMDTEKILENSTDAEMVADDFTGTEEMSENLAERDQLAENPTDSEPQTPADAEQGAESLTGTEENFVDSDQSAENQTDNEQMAESAVKSEQQGDNPEEGAEQIDENLVDDDQGDENSTTTDPLTENPQDNCELTETLEGMDPEPEASKEGEHLEGNGDSGAQIAGAEESGSTQEEFNDLGENYSENSSFVGKTDQHVDHSKPMQKEHNEEKLEETEESNYLNLDESDDLIILDELKDEDIMIELDSSFEETNVTSLADSTETKDITDQNKEPALQQTVGDANAADKATFNSLRGRRRDRAKFKEDMVPAYHLPLLPPANVLTWCQELWTTGTLKCTMIIKAKTKMDLLHSEVLSWAKKAVLFLINYEYGQDGSALLKFKTPFECEMASKATEVVLGKGNVVYPATTKDVAVLKLVQKQPFVEHKQRTCLIEGLPEDTSPADLHSLFPNAVMISKPTGIGTTHTGSVAYSKINQVFAVPPALLGHAMLEFSTIKDANAALNIPVNFNQKRCKVQLLLVFLGNYDAHFNKIEEEFKKEGESLRQKKRAQVISEIIPNAKRLEMCKNLQNLNKQLEDWNQKPDKDDHLQEMKTLNEQILSLTRTLNADTNSRNRLMMAFPEPESLMTRHTLQTKQSSKNGKKKRRTNPFQNLNLPIYRPKPRNASQPGTQNTQPWTCIICRNLNAPFSRKCLKCQRRGKSGPFVPLKSTPGEFKVPLQPPPRAVPKIPPTVPAHAEETSLPQEILKLNLFNGQPPYVLSVTKSPITKSFQAIRQAFDMGQPTTLTDIKYYGQYVLLSFDSYEVAKKKLQHFYKSHCMRVADPSTADIFRVQLAPVLQASLAPSQLRFHRPSEQPFSASVGPNTSRDFTSGNFYVMTAEQKRLKKIMKSRNRKIKRDKWAMIMAERTAARSQQLPVANNSDRSFYQDTRSIPQLVESEQKTLKRTMDEANAEPEPKRARFDKQAPSSPYRATSDAQKSMPGKSTSRYFDQRNLSGGSFPSKRPQKSAANVYDYGHQDTYNRRQAEPYHAAPQASQAGSSSWQQEWDPYPKPNEDAYRPSHNVYASNPYPYHQTYQQDGYAGYSHSASYDPYPPPIQPEQHSGHFSFGRVSHGTKHQ